MGSQEKRQEWMLHVLILSYLQTQFSQHVAVWDLRHNKTQG